MSNLALRDVCDSASGTGKKRDLKNDLKKNLASEKTVT